MISESKSTRTKKLNYFEKLLQPKRVAFAIMGLMQHNFVSVTWLSFFLIVDMITLLFLILVVIFHLVPSIHWIGDRLNMIERLMSAEPAI